MKGPRGRHVLGVLGREEVSVEGVGARSGQGGCRSLQQLCPAGLYSVV